MSTSTIPDLASLSVREYLAVLSSDHPSPGGGSAAALTGAIGASLVQMTCGINFKRAKNPNKELSAANAQNADRIKRELLKLVTLDAMGAQEATVAQIVEAQADYVIALKGNQGELHQTVKDSFQLLDSGHRVLSVYQAQDDIEPAHGKIEQRCIETLSTDLLKDQIESRWKNLHTIARITYQRTEQEKVVIEQRYYISSLSADNPAKILSTIRSHWQVENNLHWSLDAFTLTDTPIILDKPTPN